MVAIRSNRRRSRLSNPLAIQGALPFGDGAGVGGEPVALRTATGAQRVVGRQSASGHSKSGNVKRGSGSEVAREQVLGHRPFGAPGNAVNQRRESGALIERRESGAGATVLISRVPELRLDQVAAGATTGRRRLVLAELDPGRAVRDAEPAVLQVEALPRRGRVVLDVLGTAFVFLSFLLAAAFF